MSDITKNAVLFLECCLLTRYTTQVRIWNLQLIERHLIYLGTLGEDGTRLVYWLLLLSEKDGAHKEKIHSVSDRHLLYVYPFHLSFSGRRQRTRKNYQLKKTCDQWKGFTSASSVLRLGAAQILVCLTCSVTSRGTSKPWRSNMIVLATYRTQRKRVP